MNTKSTTILMIILIGLFYSHVSYAQKVLPSEILSNEALSESIVIDGISPDKQFKVISSRKDPFKALVIKKVINYIKPVKTTHSNNPVKKQIKVIPPLKLKITGICGNNIKRQVVLKYKNKEYTLNAGQQITNKFKVININANKVTVYSIPESRRRTFKL